MKIRGELLPGEYTVAATRSHGVLLLRPFGWALGLMVAWSFSSALGTDSRWISYLALALALGLLYRAVKSGLRWWLTSYVLTSHRLLVRTGMKSSTDVSIPLELIEGANLKRLTLMGIVDAAPIVVRVRGQQYILKAVPDAARFSHEIRQAQMNVLATGKDRTQGN